MRVLLDTDILLWWLKDDDRLATKARALIAAPGTSVHVSAASLWEMSIKRELGRLSFDDRELLEALDGCSFNALPITLAHSLAAGALPRHHDDPFDRMLIAQASAEQLTLVSHDEKLALYPVSLLKG